MKLQLTTIVVVGRHGRGLMRQVIDALAWEVEGLNLAVSFYCRLKKEEERKRK